MAGHVRRPGRKDRHSRGDRAGARRPHPRERAAGAPPRPRRRVGRAVGGHGRPSSRRRPRTRDAGARRLRPRARRRPMLGPGGAAAPPRGALAQGPEGHSRPGQAAEAAPGLGVQGVAPGRRARVFDVLAGARRDARRRPRFPRGPRARKAPRRRGGCKPRCDPRRFGARRHGAAMGGRGPHRRNVHRPHHQGGR